MNKNEILKKLQDIFRDVFDNEEIELTVILLSILDTTKTGSLNT